ncbi:MAG: phenylacetate--CoA ligase family protein [Actinomycetia bacterium]|nr:phenylacetate--CoA ligase family protein [Actinomycetes bacterium]
MTSADLPDRFTRPESDARFWNEGAQTTETAELVRRAAAGIGEEWKRIWEQPVAFYRRRFEAAGLSAGEIPPLDDIPRTTKNDLRADEVAHPPFGSYRTVGIRDAVRIGGSTGTSGTPVIMMFGPRDLQAAIEFQCRVLWRYGVRPGDSFTHSWPQGFYISSTSTALWFVRTGILEIPVGPPLTPDVALDHIRLWAQLRPDGFQMTSSQLATYDEVARENGMDIRSFLDGKAIGLLDAIFQFDGPRARIERAYGFSMRNMGGVGDIPGYGLTDCEHHTGLHTPGDYSVIQVVDPVTGRSVPEGERGHLVITTFGLDNVFMRYDIEDICTMTTAPCPCGETGPRYTLLGRATDAVDINGRMVLPIDVQLALDDHGAPEFQFAPSAEQDGTALRLRVETEGRGAEYQTVLTEALEVPVDVAEIGIGTLPRASFKPRRVAT